MEVLFYIFIVLASLVCLSTLTWTTREIIIDTIERKNARNAAPIPTPEPEPEPEPEEVIEEDAPIPETVVTSIVIEHDISGVEVVDVMWKENKKRYRYSPNGMDVKQGDKVLVPTFDAQKRGEIARKATVCSDVYVIDPTELQYRLKPILKVVERS